MKPKTFKIFNGYSCFCFFHFSIVPFVFPFFNFIFHFSVVRADAKNTGKKRREVPIVNMTIFPVKIRFLGLGWRGKREDQEWPV